MSYKGLNHLSVSGYLQMILTGLTPLLKLLYGRERENLPKSLVVQLKILAQIPVSTRPGRVDNLQQLSQSYYSPFFIVESTRF
jgi:hypothetical protein